ncbi:hypothetical protein V9T40_002054 [Parthenolecanium corni]|uniref:Uncharacterized protein n=1 Tax=Parthenolecanium corni TaxID=536013 RepID=A0AAN9THR5_9HEMI
MTPPGPASNRVKPGISSVKQQNFLIVGGLSGGGPRGPWNLSPALQEGGPGGVIYDATRITSKDQVASSDTSQWFSKYWSFEKSVSKFQVAANMTASAILRPIWAYVLPVWGCACNSLRNIIQRHQNKALRLIAGTPWYVRNDTLHHDLRIPTVNEVIRGLSTRHKKRLHAHSNILALTMLDTGSHHPRLQRLHPLDLPAL